MGTDIFERGVGWRVIANWKITMTCGFRCIFSKRRVKMMKKVEEYFIYLTNQEIRGCKIVVSVVLDAFPVNKPRQCLDGVE